MFHLELGRADATRTRSRKPVLQEEERQKKDNCVSRIRCNSHHHHHRRHHRHHRHHHDNQLSSWQAATHTQHTYVHSQ